MSASAPSTAKTSDFAGSAMDGSNTFRAMLDVRRPRRTPVTSTGIPIRALIWRPTNALPAAVLR